MGKGKDREIIEEKIKDKDLQDSIKIYDFKQNPYPYIKNAKLLVLSSNYEGFGRVLAETISLGVRCVSTDCKYGPNEILIDEEAQFLAKVEDRKDLALKIQNALHYTKEVNKDIIKPFEIQQVADEFIALE